MMETKTYSELEKEVKRYVRALFKTTLPMPPSINSYYKKSSKSPRLYKSAEAKDWEEEVQWLLKKNTVDFSKELKLGVELKLYFRQRGSDISNRTKIIHDVLEKASVYWNDNRIYENHEYKYIDKENPRVEILIWIIGSL